MSKGNIEPFIGIMNRIEYIRAMQRLTKTDFAKAIGMTPQTYNNSVGVQKSKPSLLMVCGVSVNYGVDPFWLLYGYGEIYMEAASEEGFTGKTAEGLLSNAS